MFIPQRCSNSKIISRGNLLKFGGEMLRLYAGFHVSGHAASEFFT